jgi:DNA-binding transcriptional LysR family regulator
MGFLDRFIGMAVFAKVVESASFAAAARHFGMSPAMVSKHVQTLEKRLGVQLLNRTTRRVSTTEVGQDYYERCRHILAELEEAEEAAGDLQTEPRGRLRVTAPVSYGTRELAPAVADYLALYPDVSVDLSLDDPYVDLLEGRFDLALRFGHLPDSSLTARKLCSLTTIPCAAPAYLENHGTPQTPSDLAKHNCLIYTYAAQQNLWNFIGEAGKQESVRVAGRFQANSGEPLLTLALKGAGIFLAPCFIVEDDLEAGRLIRLLKGYRTEETPVYAVYPHGRYLSAKTRTFIDFLAARYSRLPALKSNGFDGVEADEQKLTTRAEKALPARTRQIRAAASSP